MQRAKMNHSNPRTMAEVTEYMRSWMVLDTCNLNITCGIVIINEAVIRRVEVGSTYWRREKFWRLICFYCVLRQLGVRDSEWENALDLFSVASYFMGIIILLFYDF